MKIEELRIGNYVLFDNKICVVIRINPPYVDLLCDGYKVKMCDIYKDRIKPITINSDWLIKCGFEKSEFSDKIYTLATNNLRADYDLDGCVVDIMNYCIITSITVTELHHLQNACQLVTGEEINVNL